MDLHTDRHRIATWFAVRGPGVWRSLGVWWLFFLCLFEARGKNGRHQAVPWLVEA